MMGGMQLIEGMRTIEDVRLRLKHVEAQTRRDGTSSTMR
jgi:hypothetical protein